MHNLGNFKLSNCENFENHINMYTERIESLDYWERLAKLGMYSQERRRKPCVGLHYFRLRPACLRLTNLVQFSESLNFNTMYESYL